jgi:hypothetical protein
VPDDVSRRTDVFERLAAMTRERRQWLPLTFRDETEEWMFHNEMAHVDMRATLWKMTEQVKVLKKYLDRQAAAGQR